MSGTVNVASAIWDDPTFKDGPFTEREAIIWLMAHGRIIRATINDLARAWSSSTRRTAHVLRRLERMQLISIHGSGPSRTVMVGRQLGDPCGLHVTTNGWQKFGPGAGLWRGGPLPAAVRRAVFDRDGERCGYCGSNRGPFEVDHIQPVSLGGDDALHNLTVACRRCNRAKGDRALPVWKGVTHG